MLLWSQMLPAQSGFAQAADAASQQTAAGLSRGCIARGTRFTALRTLSFVRHSPCTITSAEHTRPAKRPQWGSLDASRPVPAGPHQRPTEQHPRAQGRGGASGRKGREPSSSHLGGGVPAVGPPRWCCHFRPSGVCVRVARRSLSSRYRPVLHSHPGRDARVWDRCGSGTCSRGERGCGKARRG